MRKQFKKYMGYFERIHEKPWVYVTAFVVPLVIGVMLLLINAVQWWPISLWVFYFVYLDAKWRHRMQEIDRSGRAKIEAIDRRYARRARVLAHARLDAAYARRVDEAMAREGDAVLDDFPLPESEILN